MWIKTESHKQWGNHHFILQSVFFTGSKYIHCVCVDIYVQIFFSVIAPLMLQLFNQMQ